MTAETEPPQLPKPRPHRSSVSSVSSVTGIPPPGHATETTTRTPPSRPTRRTYIRSRETVLNTHAALSLQSLTLYTSTVAASILRVRPSWLERQAATRRIPFTMLGGCYRFTVEHLMRIVQIFEAAPRFHAVATRTAAAFPKRAAKTRGSRHATAAAASAAPCGLTNRITETTGV
jgi:hypothetical protein